jgi:CheY-like chemotaxis protein
MDKITQAHIFEPFFTTKDKGKGTGLGLATVYGIVKQSDGFIWTYSEPDQGTTFNVYFPAVFEKADHEEIRKTDDLVLKGEETILVVEDEDEVRSLICETLKLNGYNVLEAGNGGDALRLCEQVKIPINIILTDMVMPQMSGRDLVDKILDKNKKIKVLFMSGYTDRSIIEKGLLEPGTQFIQKPFTPLALLRKVREVLEE